MDYTTLALVKDEIHGQTTGRDTLITRLVTAVSRQIDRHCAQRQTADTDDYFALATVSNELLRSQVWQYTRIICFPHKPTIATVTALSWRASPVDAWSSVDLSSVDIENPRVIAYAAIPEDNIRVRISYSGGLSATQGGLPADIIQAATVWAARAFKEAATGLTDQIGIDELGILSYVKAMPTIVEKSLQPYMRIVPW